MILFFLSLVYCRHYFSDKEQKHLQCLSRDQKKLNQAPDGRFSRDDHSRAHKSSLVLWGGGRADLIFWSLFLFISFTTPSGRRRQKRNRPPRGSCFHQLPDYSNKVDSTSFAGLKQFPPCDEFISGALASESAQMFSI